MFQYIQSLIVIYLEKNLFYISVYKDIYIYINTYYLTEKYNGYGVYLKLLYIVGVKMNKRILDFSIALTALILLLPVYIFVAYKVRRNFGAPVLFRQARSGLNGEEFEIIKFRTMSDDRDSEGNLLPDEYRLTEFGQQLRASSLDELPQLWNVLKGEMSIIGPRPQLMEYLPLYNEEQFRRHLIRPGVTGYAQVNGRNNISWEKRFELDTWYIDNQSMWLDIKILLKTVTLVIKKHGICAEGEATMSRFTGNK